MKFKIDTREKFHAITINEPVLAANMTAELSECLANAQQNGVKNVVLNLEDIKSLDNAAAQTLVKIQQEFYANHHSFVICCLDKAPEKFLDQAELLDRLNITPTLSEAGDIVQMEEIERELLGDD